MHHAAYWRLYVEGALRYSTVFMTQDASAVSVWIPPAGTELSDAGEEAVEQLVKATLEPRAVAAMIKLWERFAANHPRDEPHAYLSLLATHPDHQGRGLGQGLLAEGLQRWDAAGAPAYLESTNPSNDHRSRWCRSITAGAAMVNGTSWSERRSARRGRPLPAVGPLAPVPWTSRDDHRPERFHAPPCPL